jgi:23S rRNA pseudouridine1911/1915/1917 synthase
MNKTTKQFTITTEQANQRIDVLAAKIFGDESSRSHLQKHGTFVVQFDNKWTPKTYKAKTQVGQNWQVTYAPPTTQFDSIVPWETALDVIAETDHWLAINKPIGVSVHPSPSENSAQTVVNALLHYFGKNFVDNFPQEPDQVHNSQSATHNSPIRPGIVHRIDKTTSGILLIAKDDKTLRLLQSGWKNTQKYYVTLVQGTPPHKGKIEGGIMRDPQNRLKMKVVDHHKSRAATTLFTDLPEHDAPDLLRTDNPDGHKVTPLKAQILTGRTHQIRAHLSSIGYPIIGDSLYGGAAAERIFLHAHELVFTDPYTQLVVTLQAPIPASFFA